MSDKQKNILNATLKLISEQGFHDAPMSLIAKEAGVGAGTIYRYFENKETLINELYISLKKDISKAMLTDVNMENPLKVNYERIWRSTFQYCINNPQEMIFLDQYHHSPFLTLETEAKTMQYLQPLVEIFSKAVKDGEIKPMPFEMASVYIYNLTVALAKRHITRVINMNEENIQLAVDASWDALVNK